MHWFSINSDGTVAVLLNISEKIRNIKEINQNISHTNEEKNANKNY